MKTKILYVITNNNYTRNKPYSYHIQYSNKSKPKYEPIKLDKYFLPKFKLPYDSVLFLLLI